jgi:signal peptidase I
MTSPYQTIGFELAKQNATIIRVRVTGSCMYPLIRSGDWVWVDTTPNNKLQSRQILCIRKGTEIFIHRLVKNSEGENLVTKGDRNAAYDLPTRPSDVIGVVVAVQRRKTIWRLDSHWFYWNDYLINLFYEIKAFIKNWLYRTGKV